jgi:hypothetical protein
MGLARCYNPAVTSGLRTIEGRLSVRAATAMLVVLFAMVALPLSAVLNVWQDEAYTLTTTGRDLGYAFHQAIGFEQNAPLYFVGLTLWRHFGDGVWWLRLPSLVAILLAIALLPHLARRYVPSADPRAITLVATWNPFLMWAALEMRVYATIVLLSALLLLTFYDAFLAPRRSAGMAVAYAVCVAAALYTQYYLGFLVAAQAVTMLVRRPRLLLPFAVCAAAAGAVFAPLAVSVPSEVQNFAVGFERPSLLRAAAVFTRILMQYVLPVPVRHAGMVYAVVGAIAAVTLAAVFLSKRRAGAHIVSGAVDWPILVMTAAASGAFVVASTAAGVHVLARHAASLYVPAVLCVFALLGALAPRLRRTATLLWCVLALVASTVTMVTVYAPLAKPGDWIRVSAYLQQHARPGEPIAVFQAENALPLAYYYRGRSPIVAVPRPVDFHHYDVRRFVVENDAELRTALAAHRRIWLVTAGSCDSDGLDFGCKRLERYVAANYRIAADASFYRSRIRLLTPRRVSATRPGRNGRGPVKRTND